jgi:hypothetical protein
VFVCSNARSRVAHAHYALITLTREALLDAAPFRREFDCIVDEVCNRLEQ